jgi:hypothetical protein
MEFQKRHKICINKGGAEEIFPPLLRGSCENMLYMVNVTVIDHPLLRLLPRADRRLNRLSMPIRYEVALTPELRVWALGAPVCEEGAEGRRYGTIACNPHSPIVARLLDRDQIAAIDATLIRARIERRLQRRDQQIIAGNGILYGALKFSVRDAVDKLASIDIH